VGLNTQGTLASEFARTCLHFALAAELRASQLSTSTAASATARFAVGDALRRAIVRVDGSFLQRTPPEVMDGSTVLVVLQWGAHLLAANVGDSPAYLCPPTTPAAHDASPTLLTEYVAARM
jgi:serine/threonine protein phosphatase PrpC